MQVDNLLTSQLRYNLATMKIPGITLWIKPLVTRGVAVLTILFALVTLQGCVAGTVIDVVAETVEAGVELTGAAVGAVVDVVTPDGDDEESD